MNFFKYYMLVINGDQPLLARVKFLELSYVTFFPGTTSGVITGIDWEDQKTISLNLSDVTSFPVQTNDRAQLENYFSATQKMN